MSDKLYKSAYLIGEEMSWDNWRYSGKGTERNVRDLGTVRLIDVKDDDRDPQWGSEYAQGSEGDLRLTFEVTFEDGEVAHYQKQGTADSYGRESWDGKFIAVKAVEKTVYEYVKA